MTTISMKFNSFLFAAVATFCCMIGSTQVEAQSEKVQWMSMQEALDQSKLNPKKIFIDVYTDWCGWCKRMDKATFQQPHIAKYLNENFYNVKFDAEDKSEILYKGKTHTYQGKGRRGYNTMAAEITRGRLSYPTIVFMNENREVLQPIPGFQDPKTFEVIMTFFAGNHFKDTPWKTYQENYVYMQRPAEAVPAAVKQP